MAPIWTAPHWLVESSRPGRIHTGNSAVNEAALGALPQLRITRHNVGMAPRLLQVAQGKACGRQDSEESGPHCPKPLTMVNFRALPSPCDSDCVAGHTVPWDPAINRQTSRFP